MTFEKDYDSLIQFAKNHIYQKRLRADPEDLVNEAFIKYIDSGKQYNFIAIQKIIVGESFKELNHERVNVSDTYKGTKITDCYCKKCNESNPISGFYLRNSDSILEPMSYCKICTIDKYKKYYYENKIDCLNRSKKYKEQNAVRIRLKKKLYYINNKPLKSLKIKFTKIKLKRRRFKRVSIFNYIPPNPIKIKQTDEERRIKWNAYMRKRNGGKPREEYLRDKKEKATPIKELWKKANKKYMDKQKQNLTDIYIKTLLRHKVKNPSADMIDNKRIELINKKGAEVKTTPRTLTYKT